MFCSSIFPSERTGSMFLFEFRLTNRISSWSITSSIDNKSSYCPVTADSSSSRNVMHSLGDPAANVFVNIERMGYAEMLRSRGHQLHQAHRALRGHDSRLPGGFNLNDRSNEGW